jgi:Zn-finger nucleic acid-binding protein
MNQKWFIIKDIDDFTDKARAIVYNNFGVWQDKTDLDVLIDEVKSEEKEEFDKILSHQESLIIVKEITKKQKNKKLNKSRYIINDDLFAEIIDELNNRMVSNILQGLVQRGIVETAFDDESNDFVFWVKNDEENSEKNKEKPETD